MAKRLTRDELETRARAAELERMCAGQVAAALLDGEEPDATETVIGPVSGSRYVVRLYRSERAHGGIIARSFSYPGQRTSHTFSTVDDYALTWCGQYGSADPETEGLRRAAERLKAERDRIAGYAAA